MDYLGPSQGQFGLANLKLGLTVCSVVHAIIKLRFGLAWPSPKLLNQDSRKVPKFLFSGGSCNFVQNENFTRDFLENVFRSLLASVRKRRKKIIKWDTWSDFFLHELTSFPACRRICCHCGADSIKSRQDLQVCDESAISNIVFNAWPGRERNLLSK